MDPLPGKGLVRAFNVGAEGSPHAAAAPWAALGGLGEIIAQTGEKGIALLNKHKELQIQREAAQMETEFAKMTSDFEMEMLKNPNMTPEQIDAGWKSQTQGFQAKYQRDGMSPMEQDHIATRSKELIQRGGASVAKSALIANIQNTKQAGINLAELGIQTGDMDKVDRGLAILKTVMPEAEVESHRMRAQSQIATTRIEAEIAADPVGMREKLKDPNFVKNHPGVAVDDLPRLNEMTRGMSNRKIGDMADDFEDKLATGKIKTNADIRRLYGDQVPPRILEQMEDTLEGRYDKAAIELRKTPEFQKQTVGEVSSLLDGIDTAENFDERYAEAAFKLSQLPDSATKRRLAKRLDSVKNGTEVESKNYADYVRSQFPEANKQGRFGKPKTVEKIKVADLVKDGFLKDKEKMMRLGFSDSQADDITELAKKDPALAQRKFIELRKERPGGSVNASKIEIDTADALWNGNAEINWDDPASVDSADEANMTTAQRYGKAQMEMDNFIEMHPDAKPEELNKEFLRITGTQVKEQVRQKIVAPRPGRVSVAPTQGGLAPELKKPMEEFRQAFPKTSFNSGYRSPDHNAKVGGAKHSMHTKGIAVDINVSKLSHPERLQAFEYWARKGAKGFGYYNGSAIHIDFRDTPTTWGPDHSASSVPTTPKWFQDFSRNLKAGKYDA